MVKYFRYNDGDLPIETMTDNFVKVLAAVDRTHRRVTRPFTNTSQDDKSGSWVWWTDPIQEAVFCDELRKSGVKFEEKDTKPRNEFLD